MFNNISQRCISLANAWENRQKADSDKVKLSLRKRIMSAALAAICLLPAALNIIPRAREAMFELGARALSGKKYVARPMAGQSQIGSSFLKDHINLGLPKPPTFAPPVTRTSEKTDTSVAAAVVQLDPAHEDQNLSFLSEFKTHLQTDAWIKNQLAPLYSPFQLELDTRQGSLKGHLEQALKDLIKIESGQGYLAKKIPLGLPPAEFKSRILKHTLCQIIRAHTMKGRELQLENAEALAQLCIFASETQRANDRSKTRFILGEFIKDNSIHFLAWYKQDPNQFLSHLKSAFDESQPEIEKKLVAKRDHARQKKNNLNVCLEKYKANHMIEINQGDARYASSVGQGVCLASCLRWIYTSNQYPNDSIHDCFQKMGGRDEIFSPKDTFNQAVYNLSLKIDHLTGSKAPPLVLNRYQLKQHENTAISNNGGSGIDFAQTGGLEQIFRGGKSLVLSMACDKGGHATLIQQREEEGRKIFMFYDPNYGVFTFNNEEQLTSFLKDFVKTAYPEMNFLYVTPYTSR